MLLLNISEFRNCLSVGCLKCVQFHNWLRFHYGELREGVRRVGRPLLRFKDVCKRDLRCAQVDASSWENVAQDRAAWRHSVKEEVYRAEETIGTHAARQRAARKERATSTREASTYICVNCNRDCHPRIGLHSYSRRCANPPQR